LSINPEGAITGFYGDANFVFHAFLRAPEGAITTVDVPGGINGTVASSINPAGTIAGVYSDANNVSHGFLRTPEGAFTTFDVPGAQQTGTNGNIVINPAGTIAGGYEANGGLHGFLRTAQGTFTTIDPPGSTFTAPFAMNNRGDVAGFYNDASGNTHGFLVQ
jgi:hypothetical protein